MRFVLLQDGVPNSASRFQEMVVEATLADEAGFYGYGIAESHFTGYGIAAPEILLGAIATRTERLRLRFSCALLLSFNHPIRVAERLTVLDALSGGRAELGTARSNQAVTLRAFGIDPKTTRAQWTESLDAVVAALSQENFEFHGDLWEIGPTTLMPRPTQLPHPPLYVAATSLDSHEVAGRKGIGVLSGNSLPGGWDYVQACIDTYRAGQADPEPVSELKTDCISVLALKAYVAETEELAKREAADSVFTNVDTVIDMYARLSKDSPDYAYLGKMSALEDHRRDIDHLVERAPYFTVGTPEFLVERCRRLEAMGVDEIMLDIDGIGHEQHLRAIRLIGEHVIPEFA